jgi:gliding motility-associated-like protein
MKKSLSLILFFLLFSVSVFAQVNVAAFPTAATCSSNGSVTVNASAGTPPYTYILTPASGGLSLSQANNIFTGLASGAYNITVTDANSAMGTANNVTVGGNYIEPTLSSAMNGCNLVVTVQNGKAPFSYSFSNTGAVGTFTNNTPAASNTFSGLATGDYWIRVTDGCGNFFTLPVHVTHPQITTINYACSNVSANGATATVSLVNVLGGTPPYTYQLNTINGVLTSNNGIFVAAAICPPPYFVIKDACGEKDSVLVDCGSINVNVVCGNCTAGTATLTASGGFTPYTFNYVNNGAVVSSNSTGIFSGLPSNGTGWSFTITDACGRQTNKEVACLDISTTFAACPFTGSVTVALEPPYSTLNPQYPVTVSCPTCPTTSLILTAASPTAVFTGLSSGTNYAFLASDNCGDAVGQNIFLQPDSLTIQETHTCNSITVTQPTPSVGVTYFLYLQGSLVDNNSTGVFTGLSLGNYTVSVITQSCPYDTLVVPITSQNLALTRCLTPTTDANCNFAWKVDLTGNPASQGNYVVLGGGMNPQGPGYTFTLKPNTYTVNAQSICGSTQLVLPNVNFNLQATTAGNCPNGGIITATGGRTKLDWDAITNNAANSACQNVDDMYQLYTLGGVLVASNTTGVFSNVQTGLSYYILLKAGNAVGNCFFDSVHVSLPNYQQLNTTVTANAVCGGGNGSIVVNVQGGFAPYTYTITNPPSAPVSSANSSQTFSSLTAGTYTVQVNDGCGITSEYTVNVGTLSFPLQYVLSCNGTVQLLAPNVAGATYAWTNGAGANVGNTYNPTTTHSASDTYSLTVSSNGCNYSTNITVPASPAAGVVADAGIDIHAAFTAPSSNTNLAATPAPAPATGFWQQINPSSGTATIANMFSPTSGITVSQAGTYTFVWTVTDGCTDKDTVVVTFTNCQFSNPIVGTVSGTPVTCPEDTTLITVNWTGGAGVFSFSWNTGDSTTQFWGSPGVNYSVLVTDSSGCETPAIITGSVAAPIGVTGFIYLTKPITCNNESNATLDIITTSGVPPYYYNFNGGSFGQQTTYTNVWSDWFTFIIQDSRGCRDTIQYYVNNPPALVVNLTSKNVSCKASKDGRVTANVQGGVQPYQYQWSNNATVNPIDNLSAGAYSVLVTDANGCVSTNIIQLTKLANVDIKLLSKADAVCSKPLGSAWIAAVGGNGDYSYSWLTTPPTLGQYANALPSGNYKVYAYDTQNCIDSMMVKIGDTPPPVVAFTTTPSDLSIMEDIEIQFTANCQNTRYYHWDFDDSYSSILPNPHHNYEEPGTYRVRLVGVEPQGVCSDTAYKTFQIYTKGNFYIPNAFSPNDDGNNDVFQVIGEGIADFGLVIYNRWGEEIYKFKSSSDNWDGWDSNRGKPAPEGVYTYKMYGRTTEGKLLNKAGTITLIR